MKLWSFCVVFAVAAAACGGGDKVTGPVPSADGAGPPAGAPPAVQPVRYRSPAARTAIPGIARLMPPPPRYPTAM